MDELREFLELLRELMNNREKFGFFPPESWQSRVIELLDKYYVYNDAIGTWLKEEHVKNANENVKKMLEKGLLTEFPVPKMKSDSGWI